MAVLETTILLILLVIISNIISHYMVFMPTALIEIALGVMAALLLNVQIELETDWFMLLFIAPLLYADAKHFPKKELWELRAPIFANAIWLVLLTTLLGGFLINFFIEEISLPLSFALAAVLSPTDPVAVQGIAEQVKLPKRLLSLISGESLINDASGLIAFKYALAAFLTGSFSVKTATTDFLYMAFIGMLVGLILSKLFYFVETILLRQGIQDVILHVSLQVLTPFIIFIAAEIFHASGVIAVVVAGVVSIQQEPLYRRQYSEIKLVSTRVWDIIIYQLNGIVFVVLGASLPFAMHSAIINPAINNWTLIRYVVIIWLILLIIRTLWSYGYMWFSYIKSRNLINIKPQFYTALLTGLTGVRGAVTMAMVLSIPFFLINGEIFKERYLIIFLASGVILTSLIVAVIALPFLTKKRTRLILTGDEAFMDTEFEETSVHSDLSEVEAKKLMTKKRLTLSKKNKNLRTKQL
ncbi:sodium:proton antiporter [Vagococcus carniphilus]|uniref:cation:proton antiporter n=1 Tax=Vagococcus carniphilus TaxID=218144 RepID=UPI0028921399|nr:sodium:proton antiporter [Vagococcus carniphilus]MDT2829428.1 sodium:proton antiporter [Vagococcus carniphilus]MDT2838887.1 sodium:proton antiporter [Vagococcus carniphilus]MDT2852945.1 sodium:proton antiporter [Vagococcus carniphilus]